MPYGKPYLVAINHVSIFDPPFAGAFWPEQMEIIGASDVFDKPGQGQVLKAYGVIPVHRGEYPVDARGNLNRQCLGQQPAERIARHALYAKDLHHIGDIAVFFKDRGHFSFRGNLHRLPLYSGPVKSHVR